MFDPQGRVQASGRLRSLDPVGFRYIIIQLYQELAAGVRVMVPGFGWLGGHANVQCR